MINSRRGSATLKATIAFGQAPVASKYTVPGTQTAAVPTNGTMLANTVTISEAHAYREATVRWSRAY